MCALDLSIRPGASRVLDCGKVATVRGACEGKTKKRSKLSPLLSFCRSRKRYERISSSSSSSGRGSETPRGLFSNPRRFLYLPFFFCSGTSEIAAFSLSSSQCVIVSYEMLS